MKGNTAKNRIRIVFGELMGVDDIYGALLVNVQVLIKDPGEYKCRYVHRYAVVVTREDLLSLHFTNEDELIRKAFDFYKIDLREKYDDDDDDDDEEE